MDKRSPVTQVRGNPSKPVQTRRQLATDPEMCMFALTVSTVEPKNIKEAMDDFAWIEAKKQKARLVAKDYAPGRGRRFMLHNQTDTFEPDPSRQSLPSKESLYGIKNKLRWIEPVSQAGCQRRGLLLHCQSAEAEYVASICKVVSSYVDGTNFQDYGLNYTNTVVLRSQYGHSISCNHVQHFPLTKISIIALHEDKVSVFSSDELIHKDGDGDASFQLKSDSLPHAHAQSTKTFYKHPDSIILKAQELKTKTSAQTLILMITP
ncbi:hypothetical protein Tco_1351810 [Tanacetum coccineum]